MTKTDSHAFIMQALQDYLNTLPKSLQIAFAEKAKVAMDALAPSPETHVMEADHG